MSSTEQPGARSAPETAQTVPPAGDPPVHAGETLRSVCLGGVTLNVRARPPEREGLPPALYVHGLGGSSMNWSALMLELAGDVDSEAVDLPGFGYSPPPDDGDYSVAAHARAVIRYLDSCGRAPVHLFGNSLGGAVATRAAALRPDLVRTYALDLLLPVISLGQDNAWNPKGGSQWVAACLILLGWVLATTVATGATRLLRRQ